jgi:hypothetical protein
MNSQSKVGGLVKGLEGCKGEFRLAGFERELKLLIRRTVFASLMGCAAEGVFW